MSLISPMKSANGQIEINILSPNFNRSFCKKISSGLYLCFRAKIKLDKISAGLPLKIRNFET